jgi:hypothetical protein
MATFRLIVLRDEEADRAVEFDTRVPSVGDEIVLGAEVVVVRHVFTRPRTPIAIAETRPAGPAGARF